MPAADSTCAAGQPRGSLAAGKGARPGRGAVTSLRSEGRDWPAAAGQGGGGPRTRFQQAGALRGGATAFFCEWEAGRQRERVVGGVAPRIGEFRNTVGGARGAGGTWVPIR